MSICIRRVAVMVLLVLVVAWGLPGLRPTVAAEVPLSDQAFGPAIAGVYVVSRPPEAGPSRLLTLSADGIVSSMQSIQFSGGTAVTPLPFSNQQGVWRRTDERTLEATVLDLAYERDTGAFAGFARAIYVLTFREDLQQVHGTSTGTIYPVGVDPLHPGDAAPIAEFTDRFTAERVPTP